MEYCVWVLCHVRLRASWVQNKIMYVTIITVMLISKDAVANTWDILNAILGHRYHQNHQTVISSEESQILKQHLSFCRIFVLLYVYAPLTFNSDLVFE